MLIDQQLTDTMVNKQLAIVLCVDKTVTVQCYADQPKLVVHSQERTLEYMGCRLYKY